MSSSRAKAIVNYLVELRLQEDGDPPEEPEQWPDDRVKTFPTDKQMIGTISALAGPKKFDPVGLTSHITDMGKSLLPSVKSINQQPTTSKEPISKYGDWALSGIDKALGMGGKFYTPGSSAGKVS